MVTGRFLIKILGISDTKNPEDISIIETQAIEKEFPNLNNLDSITLETVEDQIRFDVTHEYFSKHQKYPAKVEVVLVDSFKPKKNSFSDMRKKSAKKLWADPVYAARQRKSIQEGFRKKKEKREAALKAKNPKGPEIIETDLKFNK